MIISSQGEACSPNEDIKALDLNGTNALRDRLRKIQASSGSGEAALLARAEIELEQEKQARQVSAEQEKLDKIEEARQALQDFRNYLSQRSPRNFESLPREEELEYSYNPDTLECEIARKDGQDIVLALTESNLRGELPLPPQLMVTKLYCTNNHLTSLPKLPDSLTVLYCSGNQLRTLPELPPSLTELACTSNQLTTLPELPARLANLYCRENPRLVRDPATQLALQAMRDRGGTVSS
jgi:Leucine Rich repeats (2 copies)